VVGPESPQPQEGKPISSAVEKLHPPRAAAKVTWTISRPCLPMTGSVQFAEQPTIVPHLLQE